MAEDPKCKNCVSFLQSMDVIAYPFQFNCSAAQGGIKSSTGCDWHPDQDLRLPLAIVRHELYLSWAWQYNTEARLLILDFRDTFFQRDPFESLTLGRPEEPFFQQLVVADRDQGIPSRPPPHTSDLAFSVFAKASQFLSRVNVKAAPSASR